MLKCFAQQGGLHEERASGLGSPDRVGGFKPQQRDLTPVLRRPVEPARDERTKLRRGPRTEFDPERASAGRYAKARPAPHSDAGVPVVN